MADPRNYVGKKIVMRLHLTKPKPTWNLTLCDPRNHFGYFVLPHGSLELRDTFSDAEHITIFA